ncbi:MAG TPA: HPF/RaiA family ribosome-associated protein [Steroidobacteraceae bacterium]|jgi:ribosome-associated translation inhibitor RaiA|nr:HPF/RaiA family ribosome-associated protein [Steroidobacteraceae bacterium]
MSAASLRAPAAQRARTVATRLPLQITFRHMEPSPALAARIRTLVARLEKFDARIRHCHVIVAAPPRHRRHGALYDFHIDIGLPDKVIAVRRARSGTPAHEDPYVALRDAFRAARRKLEDYRRTRRGDIKNHSQPPRARRRAAAG